MKEKSNNEIDLLLRRMSRSDGGSMRDSETQDQHLDVDELSSYAQNALPEAARARYTTHLAECSTCRKLVTELSLSLGATTAAAAPVETVSVPGGLKKFLASLFSPMVLRYAVPALGLIVVAMIGFVILKQRNRQDSVAQIAADQQQRVPITAAAPPPAAGESPAAGFIDATRETANATTVDQPKESAPTTGTAAGAGTGAAPVAVAPPIRDEKAAAEPPPTVAAEPPPPRPAKAAEPAESEAEERKKLDVVAKKQETAAVETKQAEISTARAREPGRDYQSAPQSAARREDANKAKDAPAGRSAVGNVRGLAADRGQADKSDAETRTVSGRRFRKERGIWTDTAYDSSTATVNVARGSEQFRALVADEPEIKKIAEQLDGEVIVVWKGRAYRIR